MPLSGKSWAVFERISLKLNVIVFVTFYFPYFTLIYLYIDITFILQWWRVLHLCAEPSGMMCVYDLDRSLHESYSHNFKCNLKFRECKVGSTEIKILFGHVRFNLMLCFRTCSHWRGEGDIPIWHWSLRCRELAQWRSKHLPNAYVPVPVGP